MSLSEALAELARVVPGGDATEITRCALEVAIATGEVSPAIQRAYDALGGAEEPEVVGRLADGTIRRMDAGGRQDDGTIVICTGGEARDGHILDIGSMRVDNYRKNPVLYYNHAWSSESALPVGRLIPDSIAASTVGAVAALGGAVELQRLTQHGEDVAKLWEGRFLSAISATWRPDWSEENSIPRKQLPIDHPAYKAGSWSYLFKSAELIEVSIVGVPSDPAAARVRAVDGVRLDEALVRDVVARVMAEIGRRDVKPETTATIAGRIGDLYLGG